MNPPVLLHIPHSSTLIPERYLADYAVDAEALRRENVRLADMHTDALYVLPGAARAVFPVSRFLVDAERFEDDALEPMAARGMGALYTVGTDLSPLRPDIAPPRREELLEQYYRPHHRFLNAWADGMAGAECLLIDCHSFPSRALPYELEKTQAERPEICIGTDPFHTPARLSEAAVRGFRARGYWTETDTPFSGTLTPSDHYRKNRSLCSIMIEVRKDLYMDEETGRKKEQFRQIRDHVTAVIQELCAVLGLDIIRN